MNLQLRIRNALYLLGVVLVVGLGLAIMVTVMPATASDQTVSAGTIVWLDGPTGTIGVGDEITVTVRISDVVNLYGIDFTLHFTPTDMEVVDADAGKPNVQIAKGECPKPEFVVTNAANNTSGTVQYAVTQLNPTPAFSGSCSVAYIRFRTLQEASTGVRFTKLIVVSKDSGQIPADAVNLTLEIGQGKFYSYLPVIVRK